MIARFFKNLMPRSLFGRSLLIIIAPVVLLQAIVTLIFFDRHWDTVNRRLSRGVAADIAMLIQTYDRIPNPQTIEELSLLAQDHMMLVTYVGQGDELPPPEPPGFLDTIDRTLSIELEQQVGRPFWLDTDREGRLAEIRVKLDEGVFYILVPKSRIAATTAHIFILWMVGSSVLLMGVAIMFLRNQVRPILQLADAAENFGRGLDDPDFKPTGATEVRQAATSFLDMKARILRHIQQRTGLLAGVSHDLRAPLTRMKLQLAMQRPSQETEDLKGDVAEMERMVEEFLDFARGQDGEAPEIINLTRLLEEATGDARRKGCNVELVTTEPIAITARRLSIKRGLMNLLENANNYSSNVLLGAHLGEDRVEIIIDDNGPGIPEDQRDTAVGPFSRLDDARNPNTAGVGLGLAIVRDIAHAHGGDLILSDSPLGGLRATLRLPL